MGIGNALRLTAAAVELARPTAPGGGVVGVRSPFASGSTLSRLVYADVYGRDVPMPVTRASLMTIPAVTKARALICGTLGKFPLAQWTRDVKATDPAPWLYRTAGQVPPQLRTLWTLDDLLFYGASLWEVDRNTRGGITDARRVQPSEWELDDDLRIRYTDDGEYPDADRVILIEGPQEGLLTIGARAAQADVDMADAWQSRVRSPVPLVELHSTDPQHDLTDDEAVALVERWEARRKIGGTAYTPAGIDVRPHGQGKTELFVEGRNASRVDWANYTNLPAAMLDGSQATASLTYVTTEGKRSEFVDYSLAYWAFPLEARLSMDDVTPRGTRVAFDLVWSSLPNPVSTPVQED